MRQRAPSRSTSRTSVRAEEQIKINLDIEDEEEFTTKPGVACHFRTPGPSAGEANTRDSGLYTMEDAEEQLENISF